MTRKRRLLFLTTSLVCLLIPPPTASAGLIAPPAECPGQGRLAAPAATQVRVMRCMTEFARSRAGLQPLDPTAALNRSARDKARDILRCDSFSHFACDRAFTYWMRRSGYIGGACWRVGENLAWGVGDSGTVRSIFRAWMRSPGHRENILGGYGELGVGLRIGTLAGNPATRVWTQHFGSHCDEA